MEVLIVLVQKVKAKKLAINESYKNKEKSIVEVDISIFGIHFRL